MPNEDTRTPLRPHARELAHPREVRERRWRRGRDGRRGREEVDKSSRMGIIIFFIDVYSL